MRSNIVMIKKIIIICLLIACEGFSQEIETIPQGTFKYEMYFAEFSGRINNNTCDVEINGNNIKVLQDETTNFSGGKVLFDGLILKHKSGVWILGEDKKDKNAEEVGGCTEFPIIYFDCKLIEWC